MEIVGASIALLSVVLSSWSGNNRAIDEAREAKTEVKELRDTHHALELAVRDLIGDVRVNKENKIASDALNAQTYNTLKSDLEVAKSELRTIAESVKSSTISHGGTK
jgi:predicted  nucleic acid-binding Zn-ribbon protein